MHSFEYLEPNSVADAVRHLTDYGTRARVLAGGTDLLIQMELGKLRPEAVVYLGRIAELRAITVESGGGLRIGAGATLREVENHPNVLTGYPALARGCREVGSVQIRNLGTLAGNACNASPSADTAPALLAYDAQVEIVGPGGAGRVVPIGDFWKGPGSTGLQPGELVTGLKLPAPPAGQRSFYRKLAVRKAMDLAMVGIAVTLVPGAGGAAHVRIALGAVAPTCFRAADAEAAVERGGAGAIDEAARLAEAACSPIDDQRASAAYRREMVRVLTARALRELL
jgi:carbon-monoxide dehydrogenase medium subunit